MAAGSISSNAVTAFINGTQTTIRTAVGLSGVSAGVPLLVSRVGSSYYAHAVLGAPPSVPSGSAAPPTVNPGTPAPPAKPVTTTGALVCSPTATSTWRDGSWRSDTQSINSFDTSQGRYAGSSFGDMTGFAFYGSKPHTVAGATCTAASVKLLRITGGDYGLRASTLRLVTQTSRPAGFPTLNETITGPALGVSGQVSPSSTTFTLPTGWGQALIDGGRGALAMSISGDSPYIVYAGRATWSAAWVLTIYWRRG
jgi:hypothetical protein